MERGSHQEHKALGCLEISRQGFQQRRHEGLGVGQRVAVHFDGDFWYMLELDTTLSESQEQSFL